MNILAHLYLSGNDEEIILGNFIADMVKGRQIDEFEEGVVRGIRLHRKIDSYTDSHPVVAMSKMRLRNKYRLYAGVIVDMFYDHFLASQWSIYSCRPLPEFVEKTYEMLKRNVHVLPARAKNVLPLLIAGNWLESYASFGRLQQIFEGMARRTPFNSGMENAVTDLRKHYGDYETEFHAFFPELIAYVERQGVTNHYHRAGN